MEMMSILCLMIILHSGVGNPMAGEDCNCHPKGTYAPLLQPNEATCDDLTGQCSCKRHVVGKDCDRCADGYWNFPNCQQCNCNGHADSCDPTNGQCINCTGNTQGELCEQCLVGYYGHPEMGPDYVPCRECPCPRNDSCYLDNTNYKPVCNCEDGYGRNRPGERCDMCSENFYGHPEIPGGECQPCDCSHNTDTSDHVEGNCDAQTGECLQCLFFTEGWNCERCQAGYYGDAINSQCLECQCDILGTDYSRWACDRDTGACNCLPNVKGHNCDFCRADHWMIASGQGCEPCECDPIGSTNTTCNLYTGQCTCKPGFWGRICENMDSVSEEEIIM